MPPIPPPLVIHPPARRPSAVGEAALACAPWEAGATPCAAAVGNFDGVHRGHAAIVARLRGLADRLGVPAVAITFDPHPATLLRPEAAPAPLSTPGRRAALLARLGVDAVVVQPVTEDLIRLPAERFYADVLRSRLRVRGLVEGNDFRFGAGRVGDVDMLRSFCERDGIVLETVAPVMVDGEPVSSSRLRGLIARGRIREATELLTSPYRLTGTVVEGARRGGPLGFPTANLADVATLLPGPGVYAGRAHVPDRGSYPAAVHIGANVTFGETRTTIEAHLIGFAGSLYGTRLDVDFLERLRDTQKFESVDALRTRLAADVDETLRIARTAHPPT